MTEALAAPKWQDRREAWEALTDTDGDALAARLAGDGDNDGDDKKETAKVPPWETKAATCFSKLVEDGDETEEAGEGGDAKMKSRRRRAESERAGAETAKQRSQKNTELAVYRECLRSATEWHNASDALRLLLQSAASRAALEDGARIYANPVAWPVRECFPIPVDVRKKVDVFPLGSRYVCVVDGEGTLTAAYALG